MSSGISRVRWSCTLATGLTLLLATQRSVAQLICPLPPAPAIQWCADLQTSQCFTSDPSSEFCRPRVVFNIPTSDPVIQQCACADGSTCGPVDIIPGPVAGEWLYRCLGNCPPGQQCELFVDGNSTGSPSGSSFDFPPDAEITCDCPDPVTDFCPLASSYCQNLAQTDCVSTDPANEACWPKVITGTAAQQPIVEACECFRSNECGPIQVTPVGMPPIDYIYSCSGACPNPNEPCEIHLDFGQGPQSTGQNSIMASSVPAGASVTCDCSEPDVDEGCCFQDGTCSNLPTIDCLALGGTPQGAGSACAGFTEACCLPDGTCKMLDPLCCDDWGGTSTPGALCAPAEEACCLQDDTCIMADPLCCEQQGGTPQGAGSVCLGDSNNDGKDDLCSPPPEVCPLASEFCANLQFTDCVSSNGTDHCWPRAVAGGTGVPDVLECDCFGNECGPVEILPAAQGFIYSCPGPCPNPSEPCQIFYDDGTGAVATGQFSVLSIDVPPGVIVTCDCPEEEPYCPLSSDQLCANLQASDCADGDATALCTPTAITVTSVSPNGASVTADACECADFNSCGPIHVDPIGPVGGPTDYAFSCTGACPPGQPGPCLVFVNGMSTGVANINASALPAGSQVRCDCETEEPFCPLSSDQLCANLQSTDCVNGDPNDVCTPTSILVVPGPAAPTVIAEACECADFSSCGPVRVLPIGSPPTDYQFSCTGVCPPGQPGPCLVHVDGMSTGATIVLASTLPIDAKVTCDCEEPVEVCPLASDYCANLQFTDCVTTDGMASMCWPSKLDGGTGAPQVLECDCFEDECGPVQIDQDPLGAGFVYSCPGPCPIPGQPCEIFFDDGTGPVSTGMNSVNSLNVPAGVIVTCDCGDGGEPEPMFEFSLDIGSDTELSDPFADGDEGADPGDVYLWHSAAYRPPLQPCGRDGFKDDLAIFGFDPLPDPPDCAVPPLTAVPVGSGIDPADGYERFFDLDGHDQTDFNLQQFVPPDVALDNPIPQGQIGPSACVYDPQYLLLSYDDDRAPGWTTGDVPTTSASPAGKTYGTNAGNDEVVGLTLTAAGPPYGVSVAYRPFDEIDVHSDMAPNPLNGQQDDDDVDSLDAVRSPDACPYWYFTADHEAHRALDPGDIYLVLGGGAVPVIDDVIHLGIPDSTDVDAFEFTWLPTAGGGTALAVLFSVDENDPDTPGIDESGGLDPRQIYASFLTGASFPILQNAADLVDDIDAITIWTKELKPLCSDADVDCSGFTNTVDIGIVASPANFLSGTPACDRADVDGSGFVNTVDIGIIAGSGFLTGTGPCTCTTSTPGAGGCPIP